MYKVFIVSIFILVISGCAENHISNDFIYIKKSGDKPECTHLGKKTDCKKTAETLKRMN